MDVRVISAIDEIDRDQWNTLIPDNNPFCKYEFLNALEKHHCVGEQFGSLMCAQFLNLHKPINGLNSLNPLRIS